MLRSIQFVVAVAVVSAITLVHSNHTLAQTPLPPQHRNVGEAQQLWQLISQLEKRYQQTMLHKATIEEASKLFYVDCQLPNVEQLQAQTLYAEASASRQLKGFEFRSAYTSGDIKTDAGDASAYAELSWDILKNGYLEHRQEARHLQQRAQLKEKRGQLSAQQNHTRCRRQHITTQFSGLLAELLDIKYQLMLPVHAIERRAYFKGWSHLDDYLVSEEALQQVSDELAFLLSAPTFETGLAATFNPPLLDLNLSAIITAIKQDTRRDEISTLSSSLLESRAKKHYQNRLRLFVRKEFDVSNQLSSHNDGTVAGIRFQMPLERVNQKSQFELASRTLVASTQLAQWERINRTRHAYLSLREKIQRSTQQAYRVARAQERVRRTLLQHNMGDEVPLAVAATRVRSLISASIEMVRVKEQLYHRINTLFKVAEIDFDPAFIRPLPIEHNQFRGRSGERSIYLWSDAFNHTPNQQILDLLNIKGISGALVSASKKIDDHKLDRFTKNANNAGIQVVPVLGNHRWTYRKNHPRAVTTIVSTAERYSAIHLDIEPHILSGYQKNRAAYMADYLTLIRKVNKQLDGLPLSLAVPLHWDRQVYRELSPLADRFYLMAYENRDPQRIVRRLRPLLEELPAQQIVIALRSDDFDDEWAMEQAIEYISAETGIYRFAIHQYRTFVQQAGLRP